MGERDNFDGLRIYVTEDGDEPSRDVIHKGIKAYNDETNPDFKQARLPGQGKLPLDIFVRDADGEIMGGIVTDMIWEWLLIDHLWLRDDLRGKGYGVRLIQQLETEAIKRGCKYAQLKTYSFQARGF